MLFKLSTLEDMKVFKVYFYSQLFQKPAKGLKSVSFATVFLPIAKYWHSPFSSHCLKVLKGTKINMPVLINYAFCLHSVIK